ncbi:hypothetical protein ACF08M_29410 [Streptomyces sp. NPDC015032]|uniref:hypothetical protein n=1 Tax=Streptomyces sp. NPDC015032 TaxID=3364937 RepID=UPI0036FF12B2
MKAELDTLATALRVKTGDVLTASSHLAPWRPAVGDDVLTASSHLVPWRPAVGIAPKPVGAELVALAMMQAMPGFTLEAG